MSRRFVILKQASISASFGDVNEVTKKLAAVRPELAKVIRKLDWKAIRQQVAREALEQVAHAHGVTMTDGKGIRSAWHVDSGSRPDGKCVGAITTGLHSYALFITDDCLTLAWAESHYARDERLGTAEEASEKQPIPADVQNMQRQLEDAFRERKIAAPMRILGKGQKVSREKQADGSVLLSVQTVKGGGR